MNRLPRMSCSSVTAAAAFSRCWLRNAFAANRHGRHDRARIWTSRRGRNCTDTARCRSRSILQTSDAVALIVATDPSRWGAWTRTCRRGSSQTLRRGRADIEVRMYAGLRSSLLLGRGMARTADDLLNGASGARSLLETRLSGQQRSAATADELVDRQHAVQIFLQRLPDRRDCRPSIPIATSRSKSDSMRSTA